MTFRGSFSRFIFRGALIFTLLFSLHCQQLMDLLDSANKVDDTSANVNADLDKPGTWMTLVYLDADNNLEGAGVGDVNEMLANYANFNGNRVIVLMDRIGGYSSDLITITGDGATTCGATVNFNSQSVAYLFEITSSTTVKCVATLPSGFTQGSEPNMGSETTLKNFLTWGLNEAKNGNFDYVYLDIWDHGAGWGGGAYGGNAVAWDDTDSHDALSITEIQNAMKAAQTATGKKVTILGFDACYMGTIENAYSFKDLASVMVASEEVEPGAGWQYTNWTPRGKVSPRTVATNVVTSFKAYYSNSGEQVTLSSIDLSKLNGISTALDAFLVKLSTQPPAAVSAARLAAQNYNNNMSVDLYDFADKISIPEAAALKNMIKASLVAEAHTAGGQVDRSNGMTVYFPQSKNNYDTQYDATDFAKQTRWDDFISGKVISIEISSTEPGDATCGAESNDTAGKANQIGTGGITCTGYIYTPTDVDIYRFTGGNLTAAGTFDITLSNIPAGANFDVMLFNTDVSPSAPVASGTISSGNGSESFKYSPSNGQVTYPLNGNFTCDPTVSSSYVNQGLCYGQGMTVTSSTNFYIVVVGKSGSYNQAGKYTLTLGKTNSVTLP